MENKPSNLDVYLRSHPFLASQDVLSGDPIALSNALTTTNHFLFGLTFFNLVPTIVNKPNFSKNR
jgi:hypothetical protein